MKNPSPIFFLLFCFSFKSVFSGDKEALLSLKSSIDPSNMLQWKGNDFCKWEGVKACLKNRVSKLVLENMNLSGTLDSTIINQMDQIRVLSFKLNSISGQIPNLSHLTNLKSLYLSHNNFSGEFPASVTTLHRLKIIVLSGNALSGNIPVTVLDLRRLYIFYLDGNKFTGKIPPFDQTGLRYLNLSGNQLSGEIPATGTLLRFNSTSFSGNMDLCSESFGNSCGLAPTLPASVTGDIPGTGKHYRRHRVTEIITLIAFIVGGLSLLCVLITLLILILKKGKKNKSGFAGGKGVEVTAVGGGMNGGGGCSWEGEGGGGMGTLVFCGGGDKPEMNYRLEDLLKASAETLGRGTVGSTYKAVMETGFIVTVKRLKDARYPDLEEFCRHVEVIGRLRHKNLVPLRAYFQAREERLLVYDYFPNGSLFSLIHGSKTSSGGKPLHWTSCLKIAEDLATGLLHIHQTPCLSHGNIKSSNVLLGSDFESCFTDFGLISFKNPNSIEEPGASSLFYRAPECRDFQTPLTKQADVYSFGVLLLELLTGKAPSQDLVSDHGSDLPTWVKSVRQKETESSGEPVSSEKLEALLNIVMGCVAVAPEDRPVMREVLRMIKETRSEPAHVSSNSSDHSPGRWSDTVQSLPRDDHLSI
ncbi:hypothetical protein L1987_61601 [Smallanthus sonchifolius]|uniref:Uncharacterized protein n=1 Tax=Smallanthus sonchifolius TaxID=185202 RepID=A0ACB9C835_9ASTR|nr:hypothetical protein L1987_61601 [Smallanthus sonchifolius]